MKKVALKTAHAPLTKEYVQTLSTIKKQVQEAQIKTALAANVFPHVIYLE